MQESQQNILNATEQSDQQGKIHATTSSNESKKQKQKKEEEDDLDYDHDMSLWLFHTDNKLRIYMTGIAKSSVFETFIIFLIVVSTIQLSLENPLDDPDGNQARLLNLLDKTLTVIFCIEVLIKVIAHGFLLNGEQSYLMVGWNRVDFAVVGISVIDIVIQGITKDTTLTGFKIIRLARVFRPMRLLTKFNGLKIAI